MTSRHSCISFALVLLLTCGVGAAQLQSAAEIDDYLEQVVRTTKIPGVVAIVVDRNSVIYSGTFGFQNVGADIPMSLDTLFEIASMTKPIAATAIMILVEQGKLNLDDPISKYLPEFKEIRVISSIKNNGTFLLRRPAREITVRDLMAHRSGLAYGFSNTIVYRLNGGRPFADNAQIGLLYDPGSSWSYGTGIGYVAKVVEMLTGQAFDEFLRDCVLRPLNMGDTGFQVAPEDNIRVATIHRLTGSGLVESPVPAEVKSIVSGNGGLYSTALDFAKFIQLFLNGGTTQEGLRLLTEESIGLMGQNQLGNIRVSLQDEPTPSISKAFPIGANRDGFGLGFQITGSRGEDGTRSPGSMSWAGLLNTYFWIDRTKGIGGALLMQYLPFYDYDAIATLSGFERRVYQAM